MGAKEVPVSDLNYENSTSPSQRPKRRFVPSAKAAAAMADAQVSSSIQDTSVYGEIVQNLVGLHEFGSQAGGRSEEEGLRGGIKETPVEVAKSETKPRKTPVGGCFAHETEVEYS